MNEIISRGGDLQRGIFTWHPGFLRHQEHLARHERVHSAEARSPKFVRLVEGVFKEARGKGFNVDDLRGWVMDTDQHQ